MLRQSSSIFNGLCAVGFLARFSYALARTPVLARFAASLGAGPEVSGFVVAISTITGIFFKMPPAAGNRPRITYNPIGHFTWLALIDLS